MDGQFFPWHWAGTGQEGSIQTHLMVPIVLKISPPILIHVNYLCYFSLFFLLYRGSHRLLRT